jgi:protein-S-isoprenylcysteine O-methyltransferase Ste14
MAPASTAPADLQRVQRTRKRVLLAGGVLWVALLLGIESRWRVGAHEVYELIERVGILLIMVCILGRTWCTLYIGGHKKRELITTGPYSLVRNPLYVFTLVGAAGIGAQSGSLIVALLAASSALVIFHAVARREEAFLAVTFPAAFADYAARVPRFWPRFSGWRDIDELVVKPQLVRRTFLDASLFLLAVPVLDLVDLLQDLGWLPVLFHLP